MKASSLTVLAGAGILAVVLAGIALGAKGANLEGNYLLVGRDLPDGTRLEPPHVVGFMTYTKKYRNMNLMWKERDGTTTSLSYVAEYTIGDGKYCETPLYWMQNNLGTKGIHYGAPEEKGDCSTVTFDAGAAVFPLEGESVLIRVAGDRLIATARGRFVDHWTRVE